MKPAISIRRAERADFPDMVTVLRETFTSTWEPHLTPEARAAYRAGDRPERYVFERGHLFWVASSRDALIGLVDWEANFVNALHVRPACARAGAGTLLMNRAESEIGRAGFSFAQLETDTFNVRSQTFYAQRGYRSVDVFPDTEWNSGLTTILLEKSLPRPIV